MRSTITLFPHASSLVILLQPLLSQAFANQLLIASTMVTLGPAQTGTTLTTTVVSLVSLGMATLSTDHTTPTVRYGLARTTTFAMASSSQITPTVMLLPQPSHTSSAAGVQVQCSSTALVAPTLTAVRAPLCTSLELRPSPLRSLLLFSS